MILVVEDELEVREELVETLELRQFEVREADGVAAAMDIVRDHAGTMSLLTDLRLGDGSGLDLVRAIRSDSELSSRVTPIILMTGHTDLTEQVELEIARQDLRMLFKPVDLASLLPLLTSKRPH